jgi:hypothetical protein
MSNPRAKGAWTSLLNVKGGSSAASRLARTRADLIVHWEADVWNWLTGVDPTTRSLSFLPDREFPAGVPIIWTTDEKHSDPVRPFPAHLEYLRYYTAAMVSKAPEDKFIWIDKSRQMLASTGLILAWDWWCRVEQSRRILWSKLTQEQAADMLNEKARAMDRRLPEWVRELYGASATPQHRIKYRKTGSMFLAVNEEAAAGAARGGTGTAIAVDEAAYQDKLKAIIIASIPMAGKVVALTTAQVGGPDSGAGYFYQQIKPGRIWRKAKPRRAA